MALALREAGVEAWALEGGFSAWKRGGYPTEPKAPAEGATA